MSIIIRIDPSFWFELIERKWNIRSQNDTIVYAKIITQEHILIDSESLKQHDKEISTSVPVHLYSDIPSDVSVNNSLYIIVHELSLKFLTVTYESSYAPKHTLDLKKYAPESVLKDQIFVNLKVMNGQSNLPFKLDKIASTSFLFCGSGTLAHQMSRNLIAWGVNQMTFIDNYLVKENNIIRQWLFTQNDIGKHKATVTANALASVHSGLQTCFKGLDITLPVPTNNGSLENYMYLRNAISEHDVIVLVTDTRESRYVPTLIGRLLGKTIVTAAIGIDTFTVIRTTGDEACYFCQDITGPHDTTVNTSIDKRCTISRPSLAALCSAIAVENIVDYIGGFDDSPAQVRSKSMYDLMSSKSVQRNKTCVCCSLAVEALDDNLSQHMHENKIYCSDSQKEEYTAICDILNEPSKIQLFYDDIQDILSESDNDDMINE